MADLLGAPDSIGRFYFYFGDVRREDDERLVLAMGARLRFKPGVAERCRDGSLEGVTRHEAARFAEDRLRIGITPSGPQHGMEGAGLGEHVLLHGLYSLRVLRRDLRRSPLRVVVAAKNPERVAVGTTDVGPASRLLQEGYHALLDDPGVRSKTGT